MSVLSLISLAVWVAFVLVAVFEGGKGAVKYNGVPVQSALERGIIGFLFLLLVGVIFLVLGFIGKFLLLPFAALLAL